MLMTSPARVLRESAGEVATALREARRQARINQSRRRFLIDTEARQFGVEGATDRREVVRGELARRAGDAEGAIESLETAAAGLAVMIEPYPRASSRS